MNKKNYWIVYSVIATVIVIVLGILVRNGTSGILFDNYIMNYVSSDRTVNGEYLMKFITFFGSSKFFILVLFSLSGYYIYNMERENAWLVINSIGISYVANAVLKSIFTRTRPLKYMIINQSGYSFPSGHSMVSMSFYTTMTYIILEKIKNPILRKIVWILNFIIVFSIGYSRIYLGVHWPTDILAGFLMGSVIFLLGKHNIKK